MSALRRSAPPPDPRQRILALLDDVADDLEVIDLDTVDGEFYWRACRLDLLDRVADVCKVGFKPASSELSDNDAHQNPDDTLALLRQEVRRANTIYATETKAADLYPRAVWRRLLEGERLAMRAAEAEVRSSGGDGATTLHLRIFSGAWTGADVEAEVRRQNLDRSMWLESGMPKEEPDGNVRLVVDFAFVDEARARAEADGDSPRFPYVLVTIPLPGPPVGVIGREYEALVCNQRGWHLALPGGGTRQEKEVALRTWTVGLLMTHGLRFGDAMRVVCQRTGLADVSQARFGQDRQRLIDRVPEAQLYLFTRRIASDSRTPGDGMLLPVPSIPEDTAASS